MNENGMHFFFETSALDGTNIEKVEGFRENIY